MKSLEQVKRRRNLRFAALVLILFFGISGPGRSILSAFEGLVAAAISPVTSTAGAGMSRTADVVDSILHVGSLRRENRAMEAELAKLREENRNLNDIVNRSSYLSNAAAIEGNHSKGAVKANIVAKPAGMYFYRFTIDKGTKDGIQKGDTVVSALEQGSDASVEGLVGYITEIGPHTAKVRSIVDEENAVSFRSIRTADGGIVRGLNRKLEGYAFDMYADLVVGDPVFTTGIGDGYEKDVYIGAVKKVETDEDKMVKSISLESAVNFHKLYEVYVLKGAR
ncbi:rod shape-determining protein MreC [Peptoniphilus ivorii]|uniref:rod shape-determining protein MreC n=1 Tax=Aedoeadaptatus ivorii TaxID=54006 RepID=UPI0027857066|nr:rod shape-determining protein MreC [Peptoniphilus ivorii]MDQ0507662.1 rod shape-determining protein MreC [Peptoniphilus ivorii]